MLHYGAKFENICMKYSMKLQMPINGLGKPW